MKKRFTAALLLFLALIFAALPLFSCSKTDTGPVDEQQEKFMAYFTEVYTAFNNQEFDKFIGYLDMDEETENQISTNLNSLVKYFTSKYNIEELAYSDNGDDTYNVSIQFLVDVTSLDTKAASKLHEVDLYVVKPSGDSYLITKIIPGESTEVTD